MTPNTATRYHDTRVVELWFRVAFWVPMLFLTLLLVLSSVSYGLYNTLNCYIVAAWFLNWLVLDCLEQSLKKRIPDLKMVFVERRGRSVPFYYLVSMCFFVLVGILDWIGT